MLLNSVALLFVGYLLTMSWMCLCTVPSLCLTCPSSLFDALIVGPSNCPFRFHYLPSLVLGTCWHQTTAVGLMSSPLQSAVSTWRCELPGRSTVLVLAVAALSPPLVISSVIAPLAIILTHYCSLVMFVLSFLCVGLYSPFKKS